jgi:subtilisin family serine protease
LDRLHGEGYRGEGVRIGVIDTGFLLRHPALQNSDRSINVVAEWDFVDNDGVVSPEEGDRHDQHEHGTLVLGALAADLPGLLIGSAPSAEYVLLKAEDAEEEYFLEEKWFAAALEYAEAKGVDIVSSSVVLYTGYDNSHVDGQTSVMAKAWNLAVGNGVIGLQGGGNAGHDTDPTTHSLLPPAGVPGVITVGAVDSAGEITRFSSDGLELHGTVKPEVLALGLGTATISPYVPGAFTLSGGTSMATPVLAGGVACLLQLHPEWTVDEIRSALFSSGSFFLEHGKPDPLYVWGYGIPDFSRFLDGIGVR